MLISDKINFQPQHLSTVITGPTPESAPSTTVITLSTSLSSPSEDHVVKLRGVPWDAVEGDIIRFVEPVCPISEHDIHLVTNYEVRRMRGWVCNSLRWLSLKFDTRFGICQGRSSGEAFVRLPTMALRDKCLSDLHGKHMGKRWIEVFKASESDLSTFSFLKDTDQLEKKVNLYHRNKS